MTVGYVFAAAKPGPLRLSWLSCRHLDLQHHFLLKANIVPTKKDQPLPVTYLFPQAWQPFFLFVDRSTILWQFLPLKFTTRTVLFTVRRCDWFDFDFSTKRLTFFEWLVVFWYSRISFLSVLFESWISVGCSRCCRWNQAFHPLGKLGLLIVGWPSPKRGPFTGFTVRKYSKRDLNNDQLASLHESRILIYIYNYIYIYIYTCRHRYTYINTYLHKSTRTHIHITFHSILFHYTICIFHLTFLYSKTHYFRWHDMTWHGMTWHTYTRHRYRHTCICTYICTYVCVSYIHARIHTHSMPEVIWHINLSIRGACSYVVTVTGRLWHPLASQVMMNGKAMQTGGLKVRAKATAREIIGRSWHKVPESLLGSSLHSLGTHSH